MLDDLSLTILRVVVGLLFIGHGSQKLFGTFGGMGPEGTAGYFASLHVPNARTAASAVGFAELLGGLGLALGFLTPVAAAALTAVMLGAIGLQHWPKLWVTEGGMEYPLVNLGVLAALGIGGPGGWSIDAAIGTEDVLPEPWTYIAGAIVAGLIVARVLVARESEAGREPRQRMA